jgi:hypothetical protein
MESIGSVQAASGSYEYGNGFSECLDYQFLKKIFALWSGESVSRIINSVAGLPVTSRALWFPHHTNLYYF